MEDDVRVSWESQIFDSNFHYVSYNGVIKPKEGLVHIGKKGWIGNRVTVQKNTKLPPYSIVASNSLINKDFSMNGEGAIYGGIPAKLLQTDSRKILGVDKEAIIDMMFKDDVEFVMEKDFEKKQSL